MSAFDPKQTLTGPLCCNAVHSSRSKIVLDFYEGGFSATGVNPMRRREFIRLFSSTVVPWPVAAHAQQPAKTHRIALVHPSASIADMSESGSNPSYVVFFKELRRLGYIEGVNLVITRYSGEGREDRFPELC